MIMDSISNNLLENFEKRKSKKRSNKELLVSYRLNNDINARNELIVNNIGLVYIAARKRITSHSSFTFDDLVQEGVIGMIKGIEKFDLKRTTSFSTYIYYWITQQIDRALMNNGYIIRLPAYIFEKIIKISQAENMRTMYEQELDIETLCNEIRMSEKEYTNINYYRKNYCTLSSLNTIISVDNDDAYAELQDFIPSSEPSLEDKIVDKDMKENLDKVLNSLPKREKEILELRFGLKGNKPQTLEEIGRKYNVTRERIRQIENKTLEKIRKSRKNVSLKEYLSYP